MIQIKDLLSSINNILIKEELKKSSIALAISEVIGCKIKTEDVEIKHDTVYLKLKPIYKNEIFLKKEKISLKMKEILGRKAPSNII